MTYAELFAGAGGLSLGLDAAGFHAAAHAEIEVHARAVLRYRWPETRLDGDVTKIDGADYAGITLLSGGSPCQDLSVAGKRAGLTEGSGTRSSLFFEQVRIWNESRAPYLLWENVAGAFSSNNGRDFAAVLSALVGSTVDVPRDGWRGGGGVVAGRDAVAAFRVLDLQHFGPPQRRVRVFVLAARAGGVDPAEVLALSEGVCGHPSPRQQSREGAAARARGGAEGGVTACNSYQRTVEEVVSGVRVNSSSEAGVIAWDNELNASTEAHGPSMARGKSGGDRNGVIAFEATGGSWGVNEGDTSPPIKIGTGLGISSPPAVVSFYAKLGTQAGGVGEHGVTPTMKVENHMAVLAFSLMPQNSGKDYTGREVEVLQPLHTGGTGAGSNQGGDVIVCTTGDITHALTHKGADASEGGTGRGTPIVVSRAGHQTWATSDGATGSLCARDGKDASTLVLPTLAMGAHTAGPGGNGQDALQVQQTLASVGVGRPRRLTPVECEKLMSWPSGWTATGRKDDGTEYALSDTARYRLCGNGVGSVCAEWIGRRLMAAITAQEAA
jgi:DNA-cytosine methyltransferase